MRWFVPAMLMMVMAGAAPVTAQEVRKSDLGAFGRMATELRGLNERPEPVAVDPASDVAAGRYYSLFSRIPAKLADSGGAVAVRADRLEIKEWAEVSADEVALELGRAQGWIEELVAAAALEKGELRMAGSLRDRPLAKSDPRHNILSHMSRASAILRADAIRLWSTGERAKAMTRLHACLGMIRHLNQERVGWVTTFRGRTELDRLTELVAAFRAAGGDQTLLTGKSFIEKVSAFDAADPVNIREGWRRTVAARIEFVAQESRKDMLSDRLLLDIGEARVIEEALEATFGKAIEGKEVRPSPKDRVEFVKNIVAKLGNITVEDVRLDLARAREVFKKVDAAWNDEETFAEEMLALEADETGVLSLCLGTPEIVRNEWAGSVERLRELRKALGIGDTEGMRKGE